MVKKLNKKPEGLQKPPYPESIMSVIGRLEERIASLENTTINGIKFKDIEEIHSPLRAFEDIR